MPKTRFERCIARAWDVAEVLLIFALALMALTFCEVVLYGLATGEIPIN